MKKAIEKADILIEALPYIKKFQHKVIVIKCGGRQLLNKNTINNILKDIVFMNCVGLNPVLLHGGGPSINEKLRQHGRKVEFHHGHRVTDEETLEIVIKELNRLNQEIVSKVNQFGARAKGLSGKIGKVIKAKRFKSSRNIGFVGKIASVRAKPVKDLLAKNLVPIISPLGVGESGQLYNINADMAAAEIAARLGAWKLVLLTDVQGIIYDRKCNDSLISTLKIGQISGLIKRKVIQEGMIPKVNACITALKKGVKKTHIIDGSIPRSLLLEIFTDEGIGTQIIK
ncbi:MAG: acetylglutamate kinase [Candidatus Omnitrophica bacterium]|nr:acetylglutamate kinase [Candidatus Omnitrophota bacterium]